MANFKTIKFSKTIKIDLDREVLFEIESDDDECDDEYIFNETTLGNIYNGFNLTNDELIELDELLDHYCQVELYDITHNDRHINYFITDPKYYE